MLRTPLTVLVQINIVHNTCYTFCLFTNRREIFVRDGPLENLWGVGGGGEVQKRIFAQGKIKRQKIHARQLTLRNIHAMA